MSAPAPAPILSPRVAALAIIGSAFGFSTITIFASLATRAGAPLVTVLAGRYIAATCLLLPLARPALRDALSSRRGLRLLVGGGIGQALIAFLSLSALAYIPAATLVFLFYTYPAWVAVIATLRGIERMDARRTIALILSLAGVVTMVGLPGAAAVHPLGAALALAAALGYAFYIPLLAELQRGTTPATATWLISVAVALIFLLAGALTGRLTVDLPIIAWGSVLALGAISTAMSFVLFLRGLATLGPIRVSIISTAEPLFAALLAAAVLHQPITLSLALGGVLVVIAVLLLQGRN